MARTVGILLFDDVEVLDFAGPFEVFSVAGKRADGAFDVFTVGEKPGPITARNGLSVNPRYSFADAPPINVLLVPGGQGTRPLLDNAAVIEWIRAGRRRPSSCSRSAPVRCCWPRPDCSTACRPPRITWRSASCGHRRQDHGAGRAARRRQRPRRHQRRRGGRHRHGLPHDRPPAGPRSRRDNREVHRVPLAARLKRRRATPASNPANSRPRSGGRFACRPRR